MPTFKYVPEHNGIEIYFDAKPETSICEELKENGWRWHRVKQCWFAKNNSDNEKFAKTLCDESPRNKTPGKEEVPSIEAEESATFNYINSDQSIYASVTITRKQQRYTISSTNNQITCCDCNRWISIHATACPNCGCPQNYIVEHYFNKYNAQAMAAQKEREQQRLREQQQSEKDRKKQLIQQIWRMFYQDVSNDLKDLSMNDIQVAYNRANYIYSNQKELSYITYITREALVSLLTSDESSYQQQIAKLRQKTLEEIEYAAKEELKKEICKTAYPHRLVLFGLSLEELRLVNERVKYISNSGEFSWSCITQDVLTADESSYQEQLKVAREERRKEWELEDFRKRDKLRYYQLHYPQYGLSPEKHMHLSEYKINDIIKKLSKNR